MDFGEILTKAWKIIWKYKVLWIFGILSGCGQGGGGGGGGNTGAQFSGDEANLPPGMRHFFYNLGNFFENLHGWQIAALVIGFALFFLFLSAIFAALSTIGRIGLIQGTVEAEAGIDRLTFQDLFNRGKPFFWRVFGFNLLVGVAIFVVVILMVIPIIGVTVLTLGIGLFCLIPLLCLLVPVGWLASVVFEQANIAIVIEDLKIVDGLKRGWEVFRDNIGNMIAMALILGLGGLIIGLLLASPIFLAITPILVGLFAGTTSGSDFLMGGGITISLVCLAIYIPILIVLGGILQAYIKSAWTLTYLRVTGSSNQEIDVIDEDLIEDTDLEIG